MAGDISFYNPDFEKIYREYHRKVYNYVYWRVLQREAAEDLTADVFVAVAVNLDKFDSSRGSLDAWIFTIARNLIKNYRIRAANRLEESREDVPERPSEDWKPDDSLRAPENIRAERILARLSEEERRFLELRYALGLSNEQVGRISGMTDSTVSQRYHRLLEKCRRIDLGEDKQKRHDEK